MENLTGVVESILFVASRPLSIREIGKALQVDFGKIEEALNELEARYTGVSGIHLIHTENEYQLVTNPHYVEVVEKFVSRDVFGELTRAQLETLTVIAYRGPITRPEIEEIRGVNCAVIIRNLRIRNLIDEHDSKDSVLPTYTISVFALRILGISQVSELPNFVEISQHPYFAINSDENAVPTNTRSV